jgi:hypothetical protein
VSTAHTSLYDQIFTERDSGNFRLLATARVIEPETNTGNGHLGTLLWGDRLLTVK